MLGNEWDWAAISQTNPLFLKEMYRLYCENPTQIHPSYIAFFKDMGESVHEVLDELPYPSWPSTAQQNPPHPQRDTKNNIKADVGQSQSTHPITASSLHDAISLALSGYRLIEEFRFYGHQSALLDPLDLAKPRPLPFPKGKSASQNSFSLPEVLGGKTITLEGLQRWGHSIYSGSIGFEYMHIQEEAKRAWLQHRIETDVRSFSSSQKKEFYQKLLHADTFERFIHVKFPGAKRFSLEGGDALIPLMESVLDRCVENGCDEVVVGMAHRGRLNVLTNILKKPYGAVFCEFKNGTPTYPKTGSSGDVKYHLGQSIDRIFQGKTCHISLLANPSHLEFVNPVVMGKARARKDHGRKNVLPIVIHGDAAFAGQGVVAESLAMSGLEGYDVGGCFHIIINNQIGFTAAPHDSRATPYASDIAKGFNMPIFHVNGDDVEAVVYAGLLAAEYRDTFKSDVLIDLVCYRRFGHNEGDEPAFTQPQMYEAIEKHPTPHKIYGDRIEKEGVITASERTHLKSSFDKILQEAFDTSDLFKDPAPQWLQGRWSTIDPCHTNDVCTGIKKESLHHISNTLTTVPSDFHLNNKIIRQLDQKKQMMSSGSGLDWAMGEALAFGSLLLDGYDVRLTGQDSCRGTFSHRHAVWTDQSNDIKYTPLSTLGRFSIYNSFLSETAALGFEYGYSISEPQCLTLWEAQFGDFANGAQVIIDQFISSAESKWLQKSGLVMLLPHGFEGQGPEHSSARLERFLQLCARDNMRVINCTTPANFFHALRRQLLSSDRKPLMVMSPKSLLRHKMAVSDLNEFEPGTMFSPVLTQVSEEVKKLIFCSGKVYYDLLAAREEDSSIGLVRLEQLYPFPKKEISRLLNTYEEAQLIWCQEEPQNMGAWSFVSEQFSDCLLKEKMPRSLSYIGRTVEASPAVGSDKKHKLEQEALIAEALRGDSTIEPSSVEKRKA